MFSPKVFMITSGYNGCNYVRITQPCLHNGFSTDRPILSLPRKDISEVREELMNSDVVVFHRAEDKEYHELARMLKKAGKKIVMDNDDTFKIETSHPLANFNPDGTMEEDLKRRQDNINEFMHMCDLVTTSTKTLAEEYREHNSNVIVLPNCVDPDDWDEPKRNNRGKVRIGLVGSVAFEYDYLHVKDLIRKLSERDDVEICLMGLGGLKHRAENPKVTEVFSEEYAFWDTIKKEHFPWVEIHLYPETLNDMELDIMLIPRRENYFNKCKSNLKFLEAGMCEIPVIAQSFPDAPYEEIEDGVNGVLIKDNADWESAVQDLIDNKEKRREMGRKAREYVLAHYDINNNAHKWDEAYSSLFNV